MMIDVFNLYLEKLQLGKPRMVHEIAECKVGCIEVLNQQGAAYYNEMGEQIKEPTKYPIFVCGTVAKWTYSLYQEEGRTPHENTILLVLELGKKRTNATCFQAAFQQTL